MSDLCITIDASTVAVAQLVESRIVIPVVVGSSPISHPKFENALQRRAFLFDQGFLEIVSSSVFDALKFDLRSLNLK